MFYITTTKRSKHDYIQWINLFLELSHSNGTYIFTNKESLNFLHQNCPNIHKVNIILFELDKSPIYNLNWADNFHTNYDTNGYPSHEVSHLYNLKIFFMYYLYTKMKIRSSMLWVDIGIFRYPELLHKYKHPFPTITDDSSSIFHLLDEFQEHETQNVETIDKRFHVLYQTRINTGIFFIPASQIIYYYSLYHSILMECFEKNIFAGNEQILFNFMVLQSKVSQRIIRFPHSFLPHDPWFYLNEYFSTNEHLPLIIYPFKETSLNIQSFNTIHYGKYMELQSKNIKIPDKIDICVFIHKKKGVITWSPISFTQYRRIYNLEKEDQFSLVFFTKKAYQDFSLTRNINTLLYDYPAAVFSKPEDCSYEVHPINHYHLTDLKPIDLYPKKFYSYKFSIVMAYYNRKDHLHITLQTIQRSKCVNQLEVIIVDDASSEEHDLQDLITKFSFPITLIKVPKNIKSWSNSVVPYNIGLREVKGEWIIIQNPEVSHIGDICHYLSENIKEDTYYVMETFAIAKYEQNKHVQDYLNSQSDLFEAVMKGIHEWGHIHGEWYVHHEVKPMNLYHFCSAIHSKNLEKIGGFNNEFRNGIDYDDNDLLERIKRICKIELIQTKEHILALHLNHEKFTYTRQSEWDTQVLRNVNHALFQKTIQNTDKIYCNIHENIPHKNQLIFSYNKS